MSNDPSDGSRRDPAWHPPAGPAPEQYPAYPQPSGAAPDQPFRAPGRQDPGFAAPGPGQDSWGQNWAGGYGPGTAAPDPQAPPGWGSLPPQAYAAPPKPGVIPLRPLGLGEILDGAFQACRRNPLATFGTAILFQTVVALVTVLMAAGLLSSLDQLVMGTVSPDQLGGTLASVVSLASVVTIISGGALLILQGVLVIPVARAVLNQRTGFAQLWKLSAPRILPLLGLGLMLTLAVVVGLGLFVLIAIGLAAALEETSLFIIIPLIFAVFAVLTWISIKLVLAPAALMLEGTGPVASARRSWGLTGRNWWRTFGIVLLTSLMVSIITSVVATPISFLVTALFSFSDAPAAGTADALDSLPVLFLTQIISSFFAAIGYAFQSGVTSLLYIDLRIRREGFDVVLLAEAERAAGQAGPGYRPGPLEGPR
ncbi:hypothetical protein E2F48_16460 [Arthrobacter crusticola]|uniref:DUF7847 domain-containing protein n=1 Tax=Arthrobacter crusticola TaxID=2547960 RepID=A0A4R5TLY1_9MICC|nr:glycerophosphoryl diester phosphodiesterase membrane domain-containing protein [Arthrobacter crusticola]TDK23577.1 hypothetical protein E2F48_16460 [Arthrobacter crusticola]